MPYPLRYIPQEALRWVDEQGRKYAIVEITIRALQGRYLLLPTEKTTSLILGVLGRAQALLDFPLFGYAYLSNHGSILVGVRGVEHQAQIMDFVHGNIARELGRKENIDWPGRFWDHRGRPIPVLGDEDLEQRLKYLLSNSTKENLVERPTRWPGAHCARALSEGTSDSGLWIDRTSLGRLQRKCKDGERPSEKTAITYYDVELSKLPTCEHMSDEEYREYVKGLCREVTEEAAAERKRTGARVLGKAKILRRSPHYRPDRMDRSPAPPVHCSDRAYKERFLAAYREFVAAYRAAFAALRAGIVTFAFPDGGVPPGCHWCPKTDTG